MGFLGGFYLFILTRGWVVARATQPKTRLGRVAISQNPTQTRGLTSLHAPSYKKAFLSLTRDNNYLLVRSMVLAMT
jgi:hypothetical protein